MAKPFSHKMAMPKTFHIGKLMSFAISILVSVEETPSTWLLQSSYIYDASFFSLSQK